MIYLFKKPTLKSRELEKDPNNKILYLTQDEEIDQDNKPGSEVPEISKPKNAITNIEDYVSDVQITDIEVSAIDGEF